MTGAAALIVLARQKVAPRRPTGCGNRVAATRFVDLGGLAAGTGTTRRGADGTSRTCRFWVVLTRAGSRSRQLHTLIQQARDLSRPLATTAVPPRKHQHRLTDAEAVAIALAYRRGATMKELAGQYGVHRTTVRACLVRLGVPLRDAGISAADHAEVIRLYGDGWSLARLAEKYGCDPSTVQRVLIEAGVLRRNPWERG